jgi:hypothetical protein
MKIISSAPQNYGFINAQRYAEQAQIRNQKNLKSLEKMNKQTVQNVEAQRATQRLENAKWDRVRQAKEAYPGSEVQNIGHGTTQFHVDVKA